VWQIEWPNKVKKLYRSSKLNNNYFEMAGIVAQTIMLERLVSMQHRHSAIYSNNSLAKSWSTKLITKPEPPIAAHLIWALAVCQRMTQVAFPMVKYWPGIVNILADIASCSFAMFHDGAYKGVPWLTLHLAPLQRSMTVHTKTSCRLAQRHILC
jgi:hypothetical protein